MRAGLSKQMGNMFPASIVTRVISCKCDGVMDLSITSFDDSLFYTR